MDEEINRARRSEEKQATVRGCQGRKVCEAEPRLGFGGEPPLTLVMGLA